MRSIAQSAMEYLMTYGWAIIVILVVLAILYTLGVFTPGTALGNACSGNAKFSCTSAVLSTNGAVSFDFGQNTGATIYNLAFACTETKNSTGGPYAATSPWYYVGSNGQLLSNPTSSFSLESGRTIRLLGLPCFGQDGVALESGFLHRDVTSFSGTLNIGQRFTGILWVRYTAFPGRISPTNAWETQQAGAINAQAGAIGGTIATSTTSTTSSTTVSSTTTTIIGGCNANTPTSTYSSSVHYVPIELQNCQGTGTSTPFQQLIDVPSSTYSNYIDSNWDNVEFTVGGPYGTGSPLYAWVEANASSSAAITPVWVDLGNNNIPASGNIIIYMNFMPSPVLSASGPTGEAPQLSGTYGQYDNGNAVFNFYDNFSGPSLNSQWTLGPGSCPLTASDGLHGGCAAGYTNWSDITAPFAASQNSIMEMYGTNANYEFEFAQTTKYGSVGNDCGYEANPNPGSNLLGVNCGGGPFFSTYGSSVPGGDNILSLSWGGVNLAFMVNYNTYASYTDATFASTSYVDIMSFGGLADPWIRIRAYPPDGVMPSVSFGSVV